MSEFAQSASTLDRFIDLLTRELMPVPPNERERIVTQYTKHFEECKACGMTEEAILARIGDPESIGRAYAANASAGVPAVTPAMYAGEAEWQPRPTLRSAGGVIGMTIWMGFLSVMFVYPILLPLLISFAAAAIAGVAGIVAAALGIVSLVFPPLQSIVSFGAIPETAKLLVSVGTGCGCIVLVKIFKSLTGMTARAVSNYTSWVVRKIKGY